MRVCEKGERKRQREREYINTQISKKEARAPYKTAFRTSELIERTHLNPQLGRHSCGCACRLFGSKLHGVECDTVLVRHCDRVFVFVF